MTVLRKIFSAIFPVLCLISIGCLIAAINWVGTAGGFLNDPDSDPELLRLVIERVQRGTGYLIISVATAFAAVGIRWLTTVNRCDVDRLQERQTDGRDQEFDDSRASVPGNKVS